MPGAGAKMSNFYPTRTAQQYNETSAAGMGMQLRNKSHTHVIDNLAAECTQIGALLAKLWVGVVLLGGEKVGVDA